MNGKLKTHRVMAVAGLVGLLATACGGRTAGGPSAVSRSPSMGHRRVARATCSSRRERRWTAVGTTSTRAKRSPPGDSSL